MLQATHELLIREFHIHPDGPTLDLPKNEIKKDRNRLSKSLHDLETKNLSRFWNPSRTSETCL